MSDPSPLRDLRVLLAAFLDRDLGSAFVVGCHDTDMLLFIHALDALDTDRPADRIFTYCNPFKDSQSYVDDLIHIVSQATTVPKQLPTDPRARLLAVLSDLTSQLPAGDHRLMFTLAPTHIHAPHEYADLVLPLLAGPFPEALRLVVRDDLAAPRCFTHAAASTSRQLVAHEFHVPVDAFLAEPAAIARDPRRSPDERAQALLQLGMHAVAHSHFDSAVSACEAAVTLAESPPVLALALAFRADALRARGDLEPARDIAILALQEALSCKSVPVAQHAAMSLGDCAERLGDLDLATSCFELVERIAVQIPSLQDLARDRRLALTQGSPC